MYNNTPLTQEQSDFAAEYHYLVPAFLKKKGFPEDDFYDVAIFGYLQAVRAYHEREDLRQYAFSTIAFSRMRGAIGSHFKSKSRRPITVPFDDSELADDYPSPEEIVIMREEISELISASESSAVNREPIPISDIYADVYGFAVA